MKNPLWSAIYSIFQDMSKVHEQPQTYKSERDESGQVHIVGSGIDPKNLVKFRGELRTQLDFLKAKLSDHLTERESYLILFAIVVYFDEMVMYDLLSQQHSHWRPFQKELFEIDNGGEIFYETVDDLLKKPDTLPFIYEVYYFCLSDGFKGKLVSDPVKIDEYKKKLQEKIPLPEVEGPLDGTGELSQIGEAKLSWWYPLTTILLLVGVYALFYFVANS